MTPILALMARAPSSPGKSRLIGDLGTADGESLRSALLRDTFEAVASVDVEKAVLFTPPEHEVEIRALTPFPATFLPQCGATLGDRMHAGMCDLFEAQFDAVVIVGSDLPTVPPAHLRAAFDVLARRPDVLVLGPAEDGGYYLIGSTRPRPQIFENIPWGTPEVLERTCEAAEALGIAVERISPWYDVDSPADLRRVWRSLAAADEVARCTRSWLAAAPSDVRARVHGATMTAKE